MAAKAKSVLYHSPFANPVALVVLKEHKDGTVDIGQADGTVMVRNAKIVDAPKHGHATLNPDAEAAEKAFADEAAIKALLDAKTRDELVAQVVNFNATAPADEKIIIAPNVGKTELVEKLLAVLVTTE